MTISIISALAENRVIGKTNSLPWYLPADLKHFRQLTTGKTIVMGLNTFKSIGEKPLPNRKNIVLTRNLDYKVPDHCTVVHSIDKVLELSKNEIEIMVCGGAQVYRQFLPLANRLYLTYIHHNFEGDIYFPEFSMSDWKEMSRQDFQPDEKNLYSYSFVVLERKNK